MFVSQDYDSTIEVQPFLQGIGGWGGGLAEYTVANEDLVHVLPDSIPRERSLRAGFRATEESSTQSTWERSSSHSPSVGTP